MEEDTIATIADRENISLELARKQFELDKREKAITAQESERAKATQAETEAAQTRDMEIKAFFEAYPQYKTEQPIPAEVIDGIKAGKTPLMAYLSYENSQLKASVAEKEKALEAEKKNKENADKSAGSKASSGNKDVNVNPYVADWKSTTPKRIR
jgi:hypothetical protein